MILRRMSWPASRAPNPASVFEEASEEEAENPGSNPSLAAYCRWADNLGDQFACAE